MTHKTFRVRAGFFLLLLLSWVALPSGMAQRSVIKQANKFFELQQYSRVVETLAKVKDPYDDLNGLKMLGVSMTKANQPEAALPFLHAYLKEEPGDAIAVRSLADAYFLSGQYEQAAEAYKLDLKMQEHSGLAYQETMLKLLQCESGLKAKYKPQIGYLEHLGPMVNSPYDEVHPQASRNHKGRFYFSSNRAGAVGGLRNERGLKDETFGTFFHDMYRVDIDDGGYATVSPIAPLVNSTGHDLLGGFNQAGNVLFFVRDRGDRGKVVLSDTFDVKKEADYYPSQVDLPLAVSSGDRDLQLVHDSIVLFSSQREGGYGGYDLWVAQWQDTVWSEPSNLGPTINSAFDEVSPHLTDNGLSLFYASNRPESIGGYDLFRQEFSLESNRWMEPYNLRAPINSSADEVGMALADNGTKAVIASDRQGGVGGYDLYFVYFKEPVDVSLIAPPELSARLTGSGMKADSISNEQLTEKTSAPGIPTKEIVLPRITYASAVDLSGPRLQKAIGSIADALNVFPETRVLIRGEVPRMGAYDRELFFAAKHNSKVKDLLLDRGVEADRVYIEGLVSSGDDYVFSPHMVSTTSALRPLHLDPNHTTLEGVTFRVLHKETLQMLQDQVLSDFKCSVIRESRQSSYQYYTAPVDSYSSAKATRLQLLRADPDSEAKVTAFVDGLPISLAKAIELSASNDELKKFLEDQ